MYKFHSPGKEDRLISYHCERFSSTATLVFAYQFLPYKLYKAASNKIKDSQPFKIIISEGLGMVGGLH